MEEEQISKLTINRRMVGKKVFVVPLNAFGLVEDVIDDYTFIVKVGIESRKVDIWDIRSGE